MWTEWQAKLWRVANVNQIKAVWGSCDRSELPVAQIQQFAQPGGSTNAHTHVDQHPRYVPNHMQQERIGDQVDHNEVTPSSDISVGDSTPGRGGLATRRAHRGEILFAKQ